jgi:hypothetical protein
VSDPPTGSTQSSPSDAAVISNRGDVPPGPGGAGGVGGAVVGVTAGVDDVGADGGGVFGRQPVSAAASAVTAMTTVTWERCCTGASIPAPRSSADRSPELKP